LNLLANKITDKTMRKLNYEVDVNLYILLILKTH
ncbi:hypothetical protein Q604_UNBC18554G0002, partial [human gut metagenome]